jgi:hypothetical protein
VTAVAQAQFVIGVFTGAKPNCFAFVKRHYFWANVGTSFVRAIAKRLVLAMPASAPSIFLARFYFKGDRAFLGGNRCVHVVVLFWLKDNIVYSCCANEYIVK